MVISINFEYFPIPYCNYAVNFSTHSWSCFAGGLARGGSTATSSTMSTSRIDTMSTWTLPSGKRSRSLSNGWGEKVRRWQHLSWLNLSHLTLNLPVKIELYGFYVYYSVQNWDFGMLSLQYMYFITHIIEFPVTEHWSHKIYIFVYCNNEMDGIRIFE